MPNSKTSAEINLAAVDVGTNSSHMIIVNLSGGGAFKVVDRLKHWIRLGDGLNKKGRIDRPAIERLLKSLSYFKQLAETYHAPLICIATSALRDAVNQAEIIAEVKEQLDLRLDVVSGQEEARLIFQGVRSEGHMGEAPIQVVDIGGGSTEIVVGTRSGVLAVESLDMGARRFAHKYFSDGKYTNRHIKSCRQDASGRIQSVTSALQKWEVSLTIGTSGTIRAQAALLKKLAGVRQSHSIRLKELRAMLPLLVDRMQRSESFPGVDAERLPTLVPGNLILQEVMIALGINELELCQSALREGIIFDRMESFADFPTQPMQAAMVAMVERFNLDVRQIERVTSTAKQIFDLCCQPLNLSDEDLELLQSACGLHEIGQCVSHKRMHIHGGYMVRHADLTGFTLRQQQILSATIRYHRKAKPRCQHRELQGMSSDDVKRVFGLAAILRLATALNRTKRGLPAQPVVVNSKRGLRWCFDAQWWLSHEVCIWSGREEKRPLEKLLGTSIRFIKGVQ